MLLADDPYSIHDLADKTKLKVRTIRFYQQEGLTQAPNARGKKVKYGDADVTRLLLIKELRKNRCTIDEIRQQVSPLDDESVTRRLEELRSSPSSAADYARSVREASERSAKPDTPVRHRPPASTGARPLGAIYDRITITPDIELHVRGPLSQFENTMLLQLLQAADRIYQSRTAEGR